MVFIIYLLRMKNIKLAYVCIGLAPELGGPIYNLLQELSKKIKVVNLSVRQEYSLEKTQKTEKINENFIVRRYGYKRSRLSKSIIIPEDIEKILDEEKPDVVQVDEFYNLPAIVAGNWAQKNNVPLIINSRMRYRRGLLRNLALWAFKVKAKKMVNYSHKIIATQGKCSEEEFLRWFPGKKDQIVCISTGLDIKNFKTQKKKGDFRKVLHIPKDKIVILNVARIYPVKRLDLALRAFAKLKTEFPNVVFVNVGPEELGEKDKLKSIASNLGLVLGKDVVFAGPMKNADLPLAYKYSDVFLNTSETEGICFSFLEAMAFNLPVVAFDVGGNSGVVDSGKTGFLVPFGDIRGIREKISLIIKDEKLRKGMGKAGFTKLQNEFNIKENAEKVLRVICAES